MALVSRFSSTCFSFDGSAQTQTSGSATLVRTWTLASLARSAANLCTSSIRLATLTESSLSGMVPASILETSRMSSMIWHSSAPLVSMSRQYSRYFSVPTGPNTSALMTWGEADDGVQRRAQLVAHIGQELRLGSVGQLRRLLGVDQRGFRLLAVGDVQRHGHHVGDAAEIVAHRRLGGQEDALHALRGDEHLLEAGRRVAILEDLQIQGQGVARIVVVQQLDGGLARRLVRPDPEEIGLVGVDEGVAAGRGGGADHRRHRVDHPQQTLVALHAVPARAGRSRARCGAPG